MTIARRILLLAGVTPLVLIALGVLNQIEIGSIERRSRFVAQVQVPSLSALGNISRTFEEMRVALRDHLLAIDPASRTADRETFTTRQGELVRLLRQYADGLVSDEQDRRLLDEFRASHAEWTSVAEAMMSLAESGRGDEAAAMLHGARMKALGTRTSDVFREWIAHNGALATTAGDDVVSGLGNAQRRFLIAVALAVLLSGGLGFLTYRSIVGPTRALQASVESIVGGDYATAVPFTHAMDEIGALARSIDVLRRGAGAMEDQRWVKANIATLTGELQGAATQVEFGERLLSGLVPALGGGVAGFYALDPGETRLRRIAHYGLEESAQSREWIGLGVTSVKPLHCRCIFELWPLP